MAIRYHKYVPNLWDDLDLEDLMGELSDFLDMSDDLLTEPLQIQGGELAVRPGAGLGVEIDPDKLARYPQDACARHVPPNPEVPTTHHDKENTEMSIDQNASAAASG